MNVHEYQAKALLREFGVPVPEGRLATTPEEAEKAARALGELAAGDAHNFNNLLPVVMGNAEQIAMRDDIPENIREDTDRLGAALEDHGFFAQAVEV